jgi:hypothetical protein
LEAIANQETTVAGALTDDSPKTDDAPSIE